MRKVWFWLFGTAILAVAVWFFLLRGSGAEPEIEYRYEAARIGELTRSISATGTVVALTTVDVKSKAGGIVEHLAVDEGSVVKKGDLIAEIDPRDTRAIYEQAQADLRQAEARAGQANVNLNLQKANTKTSLELAEAAVHTAQLRLDRAKLEADRQPTASSASLRNAQAAHTQAQQDLVRYREVTRPQLSKDTQAAFNRAKADLDAAKSDYDRQMGLLKQGYVSQAVVDRSKSSLEAAQASYVTAQQRLSTLERDLNVQDRNFELAVTRAKAQLDQATADQAQVAIAEKSLAEAKKALEAARIEHQRAQDATRNDQLRAMDRTAAQAATVRSKVALDNAEVQMNSTTVLAPRDGVVTLKYLEEGTIIPPGTSTFAQGTSIVQISDVSTLFVDCNVDEADVGSVRVGQDVHIVTEAYPGQRVAGVVERVNPSATTDNNITAVKVRVRVLPGAKTPLLPGFTATCEFLTLSKKDVLMVPSQAVQREEGRTFVKVKGANLLKPELRDVKVGEAGDNGVEILEGLKEGEEVVTAEIDLAELRETQEKMMEAQEGGGLAGGQGRPRSRTSGTTQSKTGAGGAGGAGTAGGTGGAGGAGGSGGAGGAGGGAGSGGSGGTGGSGGSGGGGTGAGGGGASTGGGGGSGAASGAGSVGKG